MILDSAAADLPQSDDAFLGSHAAASQHDEVLIHLTVVWKSSHRGDRLLRRVVVCWRVVLNHLAILRVHALTTHRDQLLIHGRHLPVITKFPQLFTTFQFSSEYLPSIDPCNSSNAKRKSCYFSLHYSYDLSYCDNRVPCAQLYVVKNSFFAHLVPRTILVINDKMQPGHIFADFSLLLTFLWSLFKFPDFSVFSTETSGHPAHHKSLVYSSQLTILLWRQPLDSKKTSHPCRSSAKRCKV